MSIQPLRMETGTGNGVETDGAGTDGVSGQRRTRSIIDL